MFKKNQPPLTNQPMQFSDGNTVPINMEREDIRLGSNTSNQDTKKMGKSERETEKT
jgi:hypothetical protein